MTEKSQESGSGRLETLAQSLAEYRVMNRALEMISLETDFDTSVNKLLAIIGQELHADRCYVFRFSEDGAYCDNTYEWVIRPEIAEIGNLQHIPSYNYSWYKRLVRGNPLIINDTDQPSDEFKDVISLLRRQHIKSIFLVDLCENGRLVGFLGVDFVDRYSVVSEGLIQMLRNAAKLYGIAAERAANIRTIQKKNREIADHEALLGTVIDALPASVFAKDAEDGFRYVMANRHFANFVGKTVDCVIGKTDRDLFTQSGDCTWVESRDKEIMSDGKVRNFPEAVCDAAGRKHQFHTVKRSYVGQDGKKLLLGISVDVSRSENINKNREIMRQCLETLVLNPDFSKGISRSISLVREYLGADRIYFFKFDLPNRVGEFYREYCAPDVLPLIDGKGKIPLSPFIDWEKYFHDECFLKIPDLSNEIVFEKLGRDFEKIIKSRNAGSLYCHRILIQGNLWGYVGIVFEKRKRILVTEELDFVQSIARFVEIMIQREQMQEDLFLSLEKAKASERAKSYFLATMSHEIRTPLNAVIGFSEILKDGDLPPETQKNYLTDISVAGNALLALINDVLDLSKLEAGQMVFTPTETDFAGLVNEVAVIFQQKLRDKQLKNVIRIDTMPTLLIDKLRMRQILFNLMGNAVKFTDQGYIDFSATFTPDEADCGTLCFTLTDTGCGISADEQKRLFHPFVQAKTVRGTQAEKNGTGLGLAIIRRMLNFLNGDIRLTSERGKGSAFTVTMHDVGYVVRRRSNTVPAAVPGSAHVLSGRVLVVDDVVMNLKVTQAMLTKLGITAEIAASPKAALECLARDPDIALILCDLWMPGMSGDELAGKIRKLYPGRKLKIIALTADTEAGETFDMSMFDDVLRKPISMDALRKTVGV